MAIQFHIRKSQGTPLRASVALSQARTESHLPELDYFIGDLKLQCLCHLWLHSCIYRH